MSSLLVRPPPVRLQERTCWQALYQACPTSIFRTQEKQAEGVHDAVQAPRNNHRAVFEQTAEALRIRTARCSVGFSGMVFGSRPNFASTAVFVKPAASTVT